jgi:hypothetical protein
LCKITIAAVMLPNVRRRDHFGSAFGQLDAPKQSYDPDERLPRPKARCRRTLRRASGPPLNSSRRPLQTQKASLSSRASHRRIVAASDQTRRRIERNLHDGTQQRLVSLGLAVRAAEASLPAEHDDLREHLSGVATGLVAAVEELQEISRGIHAAILSKGGLGPAIRALARRSVIPVDLDITTDVRMAEPVEVAAYFVTSRRWPTQPSIRRRRASTSRSSGATKPWCYRFATTAWAEPIQLGVQGWLASWTGSRPSAARFASPVGRVRARRSRPSCHSTLSCRGRSGSTRHTEGFAGSRDVDGGSACGSLKGVGELRHR